jgi:hypothetical protein
MQSKTKKLALLASLILIVSTIIPVGSLLPKAQAAGGSVYNLRFTLSPASPTTAQTVTVSIYSYYYVCTTPFRGGLEPDYCEKHDYGTSTETAAPGADNTQITVSGSGNTLSNDKPVTDSSGHGSFTLTSSVAESKTIEAHYQTNETSSGFLGSASISFTTPAPSQAAAVKKATPAPSAKPATPEVTPPAALTPESIQVDGKSITADQKVSVLQDKSLTLTGKTVPNGVVTLYIFSEPKKYTVTADKDGNWTYEVSGLEPGDHHVEAEVTDPATGKISARGQVLAFSVEKATVATATSEPINRAPKINTLAIVGAAVGGIVVLMALVAAGLWKFKKATFDSMLRRLHLKKNDSPVPPPANLS